MNYLGTLTLARIQRYSNQDLRDALYVLSRNGKVRSQFLDEMRRELARRDSASTWRLV